jgi:pimeloyl-ACP methyl ester carboxylesterase
MASLKTLQQDGIQNGIIRLRSKPSGRMSFSYIPQPVEKAGTPERLLVFLSGIDNPKVVWQKTLNNLVERSRTVHLELPPLLFYDRFGVGSSDRDPTDAGKRPEEHHDANDSVLDLHQLIIQIAEQKLNLSQHAIDKLPIVFCAHSFGVCIARLYAQAYPKTVQGLLFMDSAIAGIPAEKFVPNPDISEEWDRVRDSLPEGITADMCRDAIRKTINSPISGYALTNKEQIRWTNMPDLLPKNDRPRLQGVTPNLPLVTVICYDPDAGYPKLAQVSYRPFLNMPCVLTGIRGPKNPRGYHSVGISSNLLDLQRWTSQFARKRDWKRPNYCTWCWTHDTCRQKRPGSTRVA